MAGASARTPITTRRFKRALGDPAGGETVHPRRHAATDKQPRGICEENPAGVETHGRGECFRNLGISTIGSPSSDRVHKAPPAVSIHSPTATDLIERSARLFSGVIVAVSSNPTRRRPSVLSSALLRFERQCHLEGIEVISFDGLTVNCAETHRRICPQGPARRVISSTSFRSLTPIAPSTKPSRLFFWPHPRATVS